MYRELNDYEMLYLICDSDDCDYEMLLQKYHPLIIKYVTKYRGIVKRMGYEDDDLYQIGALTLYSTVSSFNGDKNNNLFYTYFLKALENAYIGVIKTNSTSKKRVLNESISYDNYFPNTDLTYADIFPDPVSLKEPFINDYEIRYYHLKNSLDFDLACILDLKIEGFNNQEIATLLGLSKNKISAGIKTIKKKRRFF